MNAGSLGITHGMEVDGADGLKIGMVVQVVEGTPTGVGADAGMNAGATTPDPRVHVDNMTVNSVNQPPAGNDATTGPTGGLPLGATSDKDRGVPTGVNAAARRDTPTLDPTTNSSEPGAGGDNVLRGYGFSRNSLGNTGSEGSMLGASGSLDGGGATSMLSGALRAGEVEQSPADDAMSDLPPHMRPHPRPHAVEEPHIVVQDAGVLGFNARRLHIPLREVAGVSGGRVRLTITTAEAHARHDGLPQMHPDENAKFGPY